VTTFASPALIRAFLCLTIPVVTESQSVIRAVGAPGTYQIISIQIPTDLPRTGDGNVRIVANDGFTIMGADEWSLSSLAGKTAVVAIIGIPSTARAGTARAAQVRFSPPGALASAIDVEIEVSLVRGLAVRMQSAPLEGRVGSPFTFSYELVNEGNATEAVETRLEAPIGWKTDQRSGPVAAVEANGTVARRVTVYIPRATATGSFFLRLDVLDKGGLKTSVPLPVEIRGDLSSGASAGPEIMIAVAGASDNSGRGSTLTTARIRGPLFDSVSIDARFSLGSTALWPQSQAMSRLGSYRADPSLSLSSPSGRLDLGAAGRSFSDLTGLHAYGTGAALDAHGAGWKIIALGVQSNPSFSLGKPQPMLGVRGDVDLGNVRATSSLSHLRGGDQSGRQLDAAGLGGALDLGFATTFQAEVARRQFAGRASTGWSAQLERNDLRNTARVRITHAPGGSAAFARAEREIVADFSQSLSRRLGVSSSAWQLSDANPVFARLLSTGWAIRPEYLIHSSTSLALEAHASTATAVINSAEPGGVGGYGSAERKLGASINSRVKQFYVSGSVAGGTVERTVGRDTPGSGARLPKIWWNTMASWRGTQASVELHGRLEEMRDIAGVVTRQSQVLLRGAQSFAIWRGGSAAANGEVQQTRGSSARPTTVMRTGISLPVSEMLTVRSYVERNAMFAGAGAGSPWILGLRFEHSARVPMRRYPGSTGHVYRDLNGNQKRDGGEPGVGGAIATRGTETAVTDANGKYRLGGDGHSSIVLDETSLPLGWVRQTTASRDIAVGPSLGAEIHFVVAPRSGVANVKVDLGGIRATVTDAAGRKWVARMTGPAVATFESLPAGTYTLELDLSGIAEPLIARGTLPLLQVSSSAPTVVTVVLDPRPLRIWRAG
jgi:hypothetical protein